MFQYDSLQQRSCFAIGVLPVKAAQQFIHTNSRPAVSIWQPVSHDLPSILVSRYICIMTSTQHLHVLLKQPQGANSTERGCGMCRLQLLKYSRLNLSCNKLKLRLRLVSSLTHLAQQTVLTAALASHLVRFTSFVCIYSIYLLQVFHCSACKTGDSSAYRGAGVVSPCICDDRTHQCTEGMPAEHSVGLYACLSADACQGMLHFCCDSLSAYMHHQALDLLLVSHGCSRWLVQAA